MAIPRNHYGGPGDECQCGRRASLMHCIKCGSSRVYARQRRWHTHMNGETKEVAIQFRCMTCAHVFIEEEREWCNAAPIGEALAALKVRNIAAAHVSGEKLPSERLVEAIKNLTEAKPEPEENYGSPREAFRACVYRKKREYMALIDEGKDVGGLTIQQYLEKWQHDEGIVIPEGETL